MRICDKHWLMCWDAVQDRGLSSLVTTDPEIAAANMMQNEIVDDPSTFDPMMSLHWHFTNQALQYGGPYLLSPDADGNQHCPLCEFEKHAKGFQAKEAIDDVAGQMAAWARAQSLIPPIN